MSAHILGTRDEPVVLISTKLEGSQNVRTVDLENVIVVMNYEAAYYHKIIRRYCFYLRFDAVSCDELLQVAERQLAAPGSWLYYCSDYETCLLQVSVLLAKRPPNFETAVEEYLEGYEGGAIETDIQNLKRVVEMLTDRNCLDSKATASYKSYFESFFLDIGTKDDGHWVDTRRTTVPCSADLYWAPGHWHIQPVWNDKERGSSVIKCPFGHLRHLSDENYSIPTASLWDTYCTDYWPSRVIVDAKDLHAETDIEDDYNDDDIFHSRSDAYASPCVVYSFGASPALHYERDMASWGCHVHVFGQLQSETIQENIRFHRVRLPDMPESTQSTNISLSVDSQPELQALPLGTIIKALGHENQIDVLRFDCDGCEWEALMSIYDSSPELLNHICSIHINMRVSSIDRSRLLLLSKFYRRYVETKQFQLWYRHESHLSDPIILDPILKKLGINALSDVYTLKFHQSSCRAEGDPENVRITPSKVATDRKYRKLNILQAASSLDNFFDKYMFLSSLNLTVGILQCDPTIHSEVIAPLVELSYAAGFKHVVVYNDYQSMVEAQRTTQLGVLHASKHWDIRSAKESVSEESSWDFMIFVTGDEAYRFLPVMNIIRAFPDRVFAIQHHPHWTATDVFKRYMFLTPIMGRHRAVFPFFQLSPNEDFDVSSNYLVALQDQRYRWALLLLGSIGESSPEASGIDGRKSKDREDIIRYLAANKSNIVINVARDVFHSIINMFPEQTMAMEGISTKEVMFVVSQVRFIWIPIQEGSTYLTGCFASSLSYAFAFKIVLVMPRRLSTFYGLEGVVVEYDKSVTEINFSMVNTTELKRRMQLWEDGMRTQNVLNFYDNLFT